MLKSTFIQIKGISKKRERSLWANGVTSWEKFKSQPGEQYSFFKKEGILHESEKAYDDADMGFFSEKLPTSDYYRLALEYPEEVIFLDIETTGLSLYYDKITIVGWSIGPNFGIYMQGEDDSLFRSALASAKVLVTFNGIMFDVKFLHKHFPELSVPPVHLDLRFFSRRVGLRGGQKSIEREIGFSREDDLAEMLGEAAPILWHRYRRGENKALKKLIKYNHADVEGMKFILDESIIRFYELDRIPTNMQSEAAFSKKTSKIKWARKEPAEATSYKIFIESYKGSVKPLITYDDLTKIYSLDEFCTVGIDLVSSEERETGYCIMKGNHASTCRLKTDEEMIKLAIENHVDLVSIDSPLSIPRGRTSYFDDDPKRSCGITRLCERQLKKRGINSYPALIPSMQKLTQRGVELAKKFRKLGIPVIESYPGAAQDVMSIPRKQAGLKYLADGMEEFGIEGSFTSTEVSHDELDAITSAIVGHFYWTGMYEGLGDEVEDYLIIPDLNGDSKKWLGKTVIALSGDIAAGKSTAANHLSSTGFASTRYSKALADILKEEGLPISRSNLQKIGHDVNRNQGQRWLGAHTLKFVENEDKIVIDGLRFLEDIAFVRGIFGPRCFHIHIDAESDIRKSRFKNKPAEDLSMATAQESMTESETSLLAKIADKIISNNMTKSKFCCKISDYVETV